MGARYDEINKLMYFKNILNTVDMSANVELFRQELRVSFNPDFIARSIEMCKLEEVMGIDKIVVCFPKSFSMEPVHKTQIVRAGWRIEA